MKKVNVLLSSYNGEKYIKILIDSILHQENVEVDMLVRDDGSSDNTINILNEYKIASKLDFYQGKNLGPARSFLDLLKHSHDADYYAFADEDDFWLKEKLTTAVSKLQPFKDKPALYFSQTQAANENLEPIPFKEINPKLTFGESLVYEFIPGCTMVFNKPLRDIVNTYEPGYLEMHDVWIYSVALAVGAEIVFDKNSYILYRQHKGNTIGTNLSFMHQWKRRWKRLSSRERTRSKKAIEIKNGFYQYMPQENKRILDHFVNGRSSLIERLRLITDRNYVCSRKDTYKLFQLAVLLNNY